MVPAGDPGCARAAARAGRGDDRGRGRVRDVGGWRRVGRGGGARRGGARGRRQARAAGRAARGVRDPARARGRVRALSWSRLDPRLRPGSGFRVGGDGLRSRRGDRRDGPITYSGRRCAASTKPSPTSAPTTPPPPQPPMPRSRPSEASSALTTVVWPPCSRSRTEASGSPDESSTAAASGSGRW